MKISPSLFTSFLGFVLCMSLSSLENLTAESAKPLTPASAVVDEHKHADGEKCAEGDGHNHAAGEKCAEGDGHNHAAGEKCAEGDGHNHAAGEKCAEGDGHDHAAGEKCAEGDGHDHAAGEKCAEGDGHNHAAGEKCAEGDGHNHAAGEKCTEDDSGATTLADDGHNHADGETCTEDHSGEAAPADDGHNHAPGEVCPSAGAEAPVPVKIDDKARFSLDMQVEKVVARPHKAGKSFYGQLVIPPHAVKTFALSSAGKVNLQVKSAQTVKPGDLLYTLESPEIIDLQGKVDESQKALARNEEELKTLANRLKQLTEIGTRNSELETSIRFKEAEKPGLEAALDNARQKFALAISGGELKNGVLQVKADQEGSVQSVDINQGAWGEQGNPVLVLTKKGELEFKTTAYASDPLDYSGVHLALTSPDGRETSLLEGKLRVSAQIDPASQTRTLYFAPDNVPESAYAGQVARLEMNAGKDAEDGYISVPNSAVVKVGVNDVVFIQNDKDKNEFLMQKVSTLPSRRGMTPVKGIYEGQTIVTKGGYELKYVLPTQGGAEKKAAGHFHADGKFHEGEH